MALTESQQQVVDCKAKKIIVLSCAGSGKTTVITRRIVKLWSEGVKPEEILALSFSNKAAREMKIRLSTNGEAPAPNTSVRKPLQKIFR